MNQFLTFYSNHTLLFNLFFITMYFSVDYYYIKSKFKLFVWLNTFNKLNEQDKKKFGGNTYYLMIIPIFNIFYLLYYIGKIISISKKVNQTYYNELFECNTEGIYYRKYEGLNNFKESNKQAICPYCQKNYNQCFVSVKDETILNTTFKHTPVLQKKELRDYFKNKSKDNHSKQKEVQKEKMMELNQEQLKKINEFNKKKGE